MPTRIAKCKNARAAMSSFCSEQSAMAPNIANRRQRRSERQPPPAEAMPEWAWARGWFERLPDGPCKLAVAHFCEGARREGASSEEAMVRSLAYAQRLFPEEVVLWGLDRGMVPDPWHNESVQCGIRCSLLALRELREEYVRAAEQRDALLAEVQALRAAQQPAGPASTIVPFAGTGHQLGGDDLMHVD